MDANTQKVMFSSKTPEWSTPQDFYDKLDKEFNFDLDPCSTEDNAKCDNFFTGEDNGLEQDWEGSVFMNPPYGRTIKQWVKKAYQESYKDGTTVVCLLPARTCTQWWHDYCMKAREIRFVKGRLKFGAGTNSAPFPSAVVIFDGFDYLAPKTSTMER